MQQITTLPVSGYRGVWGQNLNPEIVRELTKAFGMFMKNQKNQKVRNFCHGKSCEKDCKKNHFGKILIGRDARHSGEEILGIISSTLIEMGFDVVDAGIVPTPTILFLTREKKFDGALIATASHNPPEYNGIKFVTGRGLFTTEKEAEEIVSYIGETEKTSEAPGTITKEAELWRTHVEHIVSCVDVEKIKNKKLKVVVDTINSTGAVVDPYFFELLGVEAILMNSEPDGNFAHMPEPLPENLKTLGEKVREVGADIGFAQDPDADRLVVCDEKGVVIFEEHTLSLCLLSLFQSKKEEIKNIVINLSTSSVNEILAKNFGVLTHRSKVGEGNVVEMMHKVKAEAGGEGGGGFIYPLMNEARDSLAGMAVILLMLAETDKKISEIVEEIPKTFMLKEKMRIEKPFEEHRADILKLFEGEKVDERDGIRVDFADGSWVSVRASNTEPIVRIMAEAETKEKAGLLVQKILTSL